MTVGCLSGGGGRAPEFWPQPSSGQLRRRGRPLKGETCWRPKAGQCETGWTVLYFIFLRNSSGKGSVLEGMTHENVDADGRRNAKRRPRHTVCRCFFVRRWIPPGLHRSTRFIPVCEFRLFVYFFINDIDRGTPISGQWPATGQSARCRS